MYDVIVAGLGPAGSTAACTLAKAGLKVLGIDKDRFPRYKSCGGCISTKIGGVLGFDFSEAVEETIYGATYTYKSARTMDIISDRVIGYNVMRDRFDHILVNKAREAGAEIIEGCRVKGLRDDGSSVSAFCTDGRVFSAKALVGADGASGVIGREYFGLDSKQSAVSITAEVPYNRDLANFKGKLFIDFGSIPFGYGWIFPKKDFLSVGMAGDALKIGGKVKDYFNSFVSTHEVLKDFKIGAKAGWTVPIYYNGAGPVVKGRVLLAGDTGHLVDPFLGEGIYYSVRTGKKAASVIIENMRQGKADFSEYQGWLEKEIFPEFRAAERLSGLVYNHPRLWYSILEKDPEIMHRFYDVIRGDEDCGAFYDWVYGKIRSKPWKVLRRWIESRFLPS